MNHYSRPRVRVIGLTSTLPRGYAGPFFDSITGFSMH